MENPYPISVDNTLKRNQNVDNYSMRNFRDINVQFLNLFLIAGQGTFKLDIKAEAVQTENVNGDINNDGTPDPTAEAAKAAFTTVGM